MSLENRDQQRPTRADPAGTPAAGQEPSAVCPICELTDEQLAAQIAEHTRRMKSMTGDQQARASLKAFLLEKERRQITALSDAQLSAGIERYQSKASSGDEKATGVLDRLIGERARREHSAEARAEDGREPEQHQQPEGEDRAPTDPFVWRITEPTGNVLSPPDVNTIVNWLLVGKVSLDAECFDERAFEQWRAKPYDKKSRKEKSLTEEAFRGSLRDTLGSKEFEIRVLFDPTGAWRLKGFKAGTSFVFIPLFLLTLYGLIMNTSAYYHLSYWGAALAVVLTIMTIPTLVVPFVIGLIAAKIHGVGSPLTLPMGTPIALLVCFLGSAVIGGAPGWVVGHLIGKGTPRKLDNGGNIPYQGKLSAVDPEALTSPIPTPFWKRMRAPTIFAAFGLICLIAGVALARSYDRAYSWEGVFS